VGYQHAAESSTAFLTPASRFWFLLGAVECKHLLLPCQIIFLVMTGNAGRGDCFPILRRGVKQLWLELGKIIATLSSCRALRYQFALMLSVPQRRN